MDKDSAYKEFKKDFAKQGEDMAFRFAEWDALDPKDTPKAEAAYDVYYKAFMRLNATIEAWNRDYPNRHR